MIETSPASTRIKTIKISSEAFEHEGDIPAKFTCDGINVNPPITIGSLPEETKSLAIIVDDPDAPIREWVHWVVWNMPATHKIEENTKSGKVGINDFGTYKYSGPCPPSGTHRYFFKIYALDTLLYLPINSSKFELEKAMGSHIVGYGELIGLYRSDYS